MPAFFGKNVVGIQNVVVQKSDAQYNVCKANSLSLGTISFDIEIVFSVNAYK